jgi:hypothetical protein
MPPAILWPVLRISAKSISFELATLNKRVRGFVPGWCGAAMPKTWVSQ